MGEIRNKVIVIFLEQTNSNVLGESPVQYGSRVELEDVQLALKAAYNFQCLFLVCLKE